MDKKIIVTMSQFETKYTQKKRLLRHAGSTCTVAPGKSFKKLAFMYSVMPHLHW